MARTPKRGLDYFSFDTDLFEDDKIFDVQEKYGPLGEVIYIRLLCLIYKNGYYYKYDSLDKLAALLIRSVGNRWTRNKQTVKEVILYLAECRLFDKRLMQDNVMTSRSIQLRYLKAAERRQSKIEEYSLLSEKNFSAEGVIPVPENKINAAEIGINAAEIKDNVCSNSPKSKEKKSILKDSKEHPKKYGNYQHVLLTDEQYSSLVSDFSEAVVKSYIKKIDEWIQLKGTSPYKDFDLALRRWIAKDKAENKNSEEGFDVEKYKQFINVF